MRIHVNSEGGRLGSFWWVNSDTRPFSVGILQFLRWGTSGWGHDIRVLFEPLIPPIDRLNR